MSDLVLCPCSKRGIHDTLLHMMQGHYVLVLEGLYGSLLDHIVLMADATPAARVAALRKVAQQLLVGV
jgi:hypothetical protein